MQFRTKSCILAITALAVLSLVLISVTMAAGAITLTPGTQAAGGTVTVTGTGFGATKSVGLGFGAEVAGSDSNMNYSEVGGPGGSGGLNWTGRLSHYPIKPGSFMLSSETVGGLTSTYTDLGDGTCAWSYDGSPYGRINYVTGVWYRGTTVDVTTYTAIYSATYTYYQYNVTAASGVTTDAAGGFTTSITVPLAVTNGNYNVTAVDTGGAKGALLLTVSGVIPEGFPTVFIMLLTATAVIAGSYYFRKRPSIQTKL